LYELEVLAEGIETNPSNYTKFLIIDTIHGPLPGDNTAEGEKKQVYQSGLHRR
jgi:prephenate dehydratase